MNNKAIYKCNIFLIKFAMNGERGLQPNIDIDAWTFNENIQAPAIHVTPVNDIRNPLHTVIMT